MTSSFLCGLIGAQGWAWEPLRLSCRWACAWMYMKVCVCREYIYIYVYTCVSHACRYVKMTVHVSMYVSMYICMYVCVRN